MSGQRISISGKVQITQRTFVATDLTEKSLAKLDKEVNSFTSNMAVQMEHLQADGVDKLFQRKYVTSGNGKFAITVEYLLFLDKNIQVLGA